MNKVIKTEQAPAPIGPYNQAVMTNGLLFVSGQIAINPENGKLSIINIQEETHQVMRNIKAILFDAGLSFDDVIKTSIFLTDMGDFDKVNIIYGSYFNHAFPARETIQVTALPKNVHVEISVIASKG